MAALLTAAGMYGLLAYSVNARVREFGVRAAVGASRANLVAMILREATVLMAPGLVAGLFLALAFASVMRSFVYRLSPLDPFSLLTAAVVLAMLTLISAWIPARRAAAADPAALGQLIYRRRTTVLVQYQPCDAETSSARPPSPAPPPLRLWPRPGIRRPAKDV